MNVSGQDETGVTTTVNGYVKNMQSFIIPNDLDLVLFENLIHNRLRLNVNAQKWHINVEARNRIITGDLVRLFPQYRTFIDQSSNDYFDLTEFVSDRQSFLFHLALDRALFEYYGKDWELSVGRQRINWGIGTIWNPNDYFNAYSFIDFDYEERPGTDALRIKKYFGISTSMEIAVNMHDHWDEAILAGLVGFNLGKYDWQLSGGKVLRDHVVGLGWAGNLGNAGFKGETSYFITPDDQDNVWVFSASVDHSFEKGLYSNQGFLITTDAGNELDFTNFLGTELTAKNLYPYKFSILSQWAYQFGPLSTASMVVVFSPGNDNALFLNPGYQISIAQDWDLDVVGQITFLNTEEKYQSTNQNVFVRIKWSF